MYFWVVSWVVELSCWVLFLYIFFYIIFFFLYFFISSGLRKKPELFWFAFSHIRTEYGEIRSIYPYSVRLQEDTYQNNSVYGQFSRIGDYSDQTDQNEIDLVPHNLGCQYQRRFENPMKYVRWSFLHWRFYI